jgi:hypothetical protein
MSQTSAAATVDTAPSLGKGRVFAIAAACGIAVASIYCNQPMS